MKKIMTVALIMGAITTTGCAGSLSVSGSEHASLSGSPVALRAMFDGMNGLITNGKASPDQDTAHWKARKQEEAEITTRHLKPGLLDGLFAPKSNSVEQGS